MSQPTPEIDHDPRDQTTAEAVLLPPTTITSGDCRSAERTIEPAPAVANFYHEYFYADPQPWP